MPPIPVIPPPEIATLSEIEIEKFRLEGYNRARQEMLDYKKRLDDDHLEFVEKAKIQEENLTHHFKQQLLEKEKDSNIARQKTIQTIEEIRKREEIVNQKSYEESEKIRIQMEQINKREYEISIKMKEIDNFQKEEMKKLKKLEEELKEKNYREIEERMKEIEKEKEVLKGSSH